MTDGRAGEAERAGGTIAEKLDAALAPVRHMGALNAQVVLAAVASDASCHCLCSIYEPHLCDGWRAEGCERVVPQGKILGMQPPPITVPLCRTCHGAKIRTS